MTIPLFDIKTPLAPLQATIIKRVTEVIESGRFIFGPEVEGFEHELAEYVGTRDAIGVGNGTEALMIAARALGVGPGDEVVVPSFTFYASAEAIAAIGARPVFCDIDKDTRNVTPDSVRPALSAKTKAIVAVDLCGVPAEVPAIRKEFGLPVIEDAAQALGASLDGQRAGALGDIGAISFFPSKNLGAFGDGGAITTDDPELAEKVRALRFHGSRNKESFEYIGYNSRLDAIQAAILRIELAHLDEWCSGRKAAYAAYLKAGLAEYVGVCTPPQGSDPAWYLCMNTHPQADAVIAKLKAAGVSARSYYRKPLHVQPAMAPYVNAGPQPPLPVTDELAATNLVVPISPVLTEAQATEVVAALAAN
jgi:dTDP-4-amino-4,6-dideoxygalactose transaminase